MSPKVFVSHASEDKERFVTAFATRLRENGVDAWLDRWEMLPGDSLVDKIFGQGLPQAHAVIVVISKYSVEKPWVKEELNAAFVQRINTGSKLIPIILDDSKVPSCLNSVLWEKVSDINSYDTEFERILSSVYGTSNKPPIGATPTKHTAQTISHIPGMDPDDEKVLAIACEYAINQANRFCSTKDVISLASKKHSLSSDDINDSLEILDRKGYIELSKVIGEPPPMIKIQSFGLDQYLKHYEPGYSANLTIVATAVCNLEDGSLQDIYKQHSSIPELVIEHLLKILEDRGYISLSEFLGGQILFHSLSPELKRLVMRGNL